MKSRPVNSRPSRKRSARRLATRKRLTLGLSVLVALLFAGLPALRRAEFSRKVSAQQGITPTALGTTYIVDSTGDGDNAALRGTICSDATNHCTLRGAIEASNNNAGADAISFKISTSDPGYSNGTWTINLTKALPDISDDVNITGPGADKLTVRRNSSTQFRIFNVSTSGTVNFSGLNIINGRALTTTAQRMSPIAPSAVIMPTSTAAALTTTAQRTSPTARSVGTRLLSSAAAFSIAAH